MVSIKMSRISHIIDIVQQGHLGRVSSDMCESSEYIKPELLVREPSENRETIKWGWGVINAFSPDYHGPFPDQLGH